MAMPYVLIIHEINEDSAVETASTQTKSASADGRK